MPINHLTRRAATLVLGLGLAMSGCSRGQREVATVQDPSVSGAYAELVSAFATCAQQVSDCVKNAQGDSAALQTCRDDFASCRDSAGQGAVNSMADAIRGCTDTNRQCEAANHGSTGSSGCEQALLTCLQANHPQRPGSAKNDNDGGDDPDQSGAHSQGAQVADCIDTLHSCVRSGGQPQDCAHAVRACVLAAVPAANVVVPGGGSSGAAHGGAGHSGNTPDPHSADAGRPTNPGMSSGQMGGAGAGMMHAADAGAAMSSPALQCLDAFQMCMKAGGQARTCAQGLQQCNQTARP